MLFWFLSLFAQHLFLNPFLFGDHRIRIRQSIVNRGSLLNGTYNLVYETDTKNERH